MSQSIFPADTATKLIESLTSVISANMPIIIALLGFTWGFYFLADIFKENVRDVFKIFQAYAKIEIWKLLQQFLFFWYYLYIPWL